MTDIVPVLLVDCETCQSADRYGRHTDELDDEEYLVVRGVERSVAEHSDMQIVDTDGDVWDDAFDDLGEGEERRLGL